MRARMSISRHPMNILSYVLHAVVFLCCYGCVCVAADALQASSKSVSTNILGSELTAGISRQMLWSKSQHLIVLSNGVMGNRYDLTFLSERLQTYGCVVLQSKSNEFLGTLDGVEVGGQRLADEIIVELQRHPQLKAISVVGNSLGGLYVRYALKELYHEENGTIAGLVPQNFLTIATPHMGVRRHTFLEDYTGGRIPSTLPGLDFAADLAKRIVARTMKKTGQDLFSLDCDSPQTTQSTSRSSTKLEHDNYTSTACKGGLSSTLLYRMATEESYLAPLKSFQQRRLLANLQRDFVVPLGTAAFLPDKHVKMLRSTHDKQYGVVTVLHTAATTGVAATTTTSAATTPNAGSAATGAASDSTNMQTILQQEQEQQGSVNTDYDYNECSVNTDYDYNDGDPDESRHRSAMRESLNSCGWEKLIVHFPGTIPLAHNKIAALTKYTAAVDALLGFTAGRSLMRDTAHWLATGATITTDTAAASVDVEVEIEYKSEL